MAVQAEGSSNLIDNLNKEIFKIRTSKTVADSISVDIPRNFYMAQQFMKNYHGRCIKVSDEAILAASSRLSQTYGLFAEPAAAAAYAGFRQWQSEGKSAPNTKNVVLLTGSGLKDTDAIKSILKKPEPILPDIQDLKTFLS